MTTPEFSASGSSSNEKKYEFGGLAIGGSISGQITELGEAAWPDAGDQYA